MFGCCAPGAVEGLQQGKPYPKHPWRPPGSAGASPGWGEAQGRCLRGSSAIPNGKSHGSGMFGLVPRPCWDPRLGSWEEGGPSSCAQSTSLEKSRTPGVLQGGLIPPGAPGLGQGSAPIPYSAFAKPHSLWGGFQIKLFKQQSKISLLNLCLIP